MAYCTADDVQVLIKNITFGTDTTVTTDELTNYHIPAADAYIDSRLRKFYTVPITNTDDLKLIKFISMTLAAAHALGVMFDTTTQERGATNPAERRLQQALNLLDQIEQGVITLKTTRNETLWSFGQTIYDATDQTKIEPQVTLDKEF